MSYGDSVDLSAAELEQEMAKSTFAGYDVPDSLRNNIALFLRLVRKVLGEYDEELLEKFDVLLTHTIRGMDDDSDDHKKSQAELNGFVNQIDSLELSQTRILMRAYVTFFHLANICEENYRVNSLESREHEIEAISEVEDPINDLASAYRQLVEECGRGRATALLQRLEFRPVFTAHPTEARRKAVEGKIRRLSKLLSAHADLGGLQRAENERCMLQEIEALIRTSPIAAKKPTPYEEAGTILDIFDNTLFDMVPEVYRRFDDWELGEKAGCVQPVCPAFIHPGSWIGSDRDGNPNVTARVSRKVAELYRTHVLEKLESQTRTVGKNMTLDSLSTMPSDALVNLWNHQVEMDEVITKQALAISAGELHRAVMMVIAERLKATRARTADIMYANCDEYLRDLFCVQRSLVSAGAVRSAYGPLQTLIWQAQTFGFHLVEMEFRQHSLVHARALADIEEHGRWGERGELAPMTKEVLDTFRAIGSIQRRNGVNAARRYIISFTQSAQDVANVYKLAKLAFAHEKDVPTLDVVPLFEQVEDLERAVQTLDQIIAIPDVQRRLDATNRRLEVMLGYSDSSKDAGPTSATFVLHQAQADIAKWANENAIDLVLMHGRGGAVGRGGGPANRAVLSQPEGSVNCCFKLTEQGEVIFARYGNPVLARRHVESVAGATLLHSAPTVEEHNTTSTEKYASLAHTMDLASRDRYQKLLNTEGFAEWFSTVTPLTEIGLMPIGSRPAKRGLGATSLADLRAIPWIFSWAQARINLAAWYGLGSACERVGDLELLRDAYKEWPLFTTFIDNIEMSLSKTDMRIARLYLALDERDDLAEEVLTEMELTRKWVLAIVGDDWPLQHRRVLGPVIRMRLPFVNVLSVTQARMLFALRHEAQDLSPEEREEYIYLILCTVSGVAAGLQNTG